MKILFPNNALSLTITESGSLDQLESAHRETCVYTQKLREGAVGPLTPPQLAAAVDYMQRRDQFYCQEHLATAQELSIKGYPKLLQRLTEVRQEVAKMQQIYTEMFQDARMHEARRAQIVGTTQAEINAILAQINANTRTIYAQSNELSGLVNAAVPFSWAMLISRMKI